MLSVDLGRLLDLVAGFAQQTICVVGDFVLDEFVSGEISRISREAPADPAPPAANPIRAAPPMPSTISSTWAARPAGRRRGRLTPAARSCWNIFARKASMFRAFCSLLIGSRPPKLATWRAGRTPPNSKSCASTANRKPKCLRICKRRSPITPANRHAAPDAVLISDYGLGAASPSLGSGLHRQAHDARFPLSPSRISPLPASPPPPRTNPKSKLPIMPKSALMSESSMIYGTALDAT